MAVKFLFFLFVLSLPATAQSRWALSDSTASIRIYFDTVTAKPTADGAGGDVWTRWTYSPAAKTGRIAETRVHFVVDCPSKRYRQLAAFAYNKQGEFLGSLDPDTAWQIPVPDSVIEQLATSICRFFNFRE